MKNKKGGNPSNNQDNAEIDPQAVSLEKSTAPSDGGRVSSLDSIADDLITEMPQVQEHALEQERSDEAARLSEYDHLKDTDGFSFDPTKHKTNKSGEPTVTKLGKLIKKAAKKAQTGETKKKSFVGNNDPIPQSEDQIAKLQARASGTVAANLLMTMGIAFGGDEWQPRSDPNSGLNEKSMLENAMSDYFEATGKTDLPPSMVLVVAVGAYALPRFTMPKTQSRLSTLKNGIKKWWINRKLKKHGFKAESAKQAAEKKEETAPRSASLEA